LIFKCDENIAPEYTIPKYLNDKYYQGKTIPPNISYFEVATSAVCLPRIISCEVRIFFSEFCNIVNQLDQPYMGFLSLMY